VGRLDLVAFDPLLGGCGGVLPDRIQNKGATVSVQSDQHDCFKWAWLAAKYPVQQAAHRKSHYVAHAAEHEDLFAGLSYPVAISDLTAFERKIAVHSKLHLWLMQQLPTVLELAKTHTHNSGLRESSSRCPVAYCENDTHALLPEGCSSFRLSWSLPKPIHTGY